MDEQLFKQTLNDLADKAIPTTDDPGPALRKRISADLGWRKGSLQKAIRQPRLRLAGSALLLAILAGAILLFTPPGQAFAQDVLHFFTRAENDTLPLPAGQLPEPIPPTRTAAPTRIVELQPVTPAAAAPGAQDYPTATPAPTGAAIAPKGNLSLEQAEGLAGFELRVPASLPPGYRLDNVTYDPGTNEVTQFYGFHPYAAGEQFILHQQTAESVGVVGQSAQIEQMTIAGTPVEYVAGGWFGETGANAETWYADAIHHTFRWQEGDFYFTLEILFDGADTWSPAYWTRDGMIAMLEIVLGVRSEFPEQININNLTSISQAETAAGFELLVPATLPEGFIFSRAVYDPQAGQVRLFYQPQDGSRDSSGVRLVIVEKPVTGQPPETWEGYPAGAVEAVMVGSSQATFVRGTSVDGIYDPETELYLVWNTAELSIKMIYTTPADYPTRLDQEALIAIAESME